MPYYTPTGNPPAATKGLSAAIRAEFTLIATGFASVTTQFAADASSIALKGTIAGQTWTGAHSFTGATLTAATQTAGDSSTKVATTAFVAATAFSPALPGQGGNAGKFVTTDGTSASWSALLKDGTIRFANSSDITKLLAFDVSGVTTATTRTVAIPNKNGTMAMLSDIPNTLTLLATLTPTAAANVDALSTFTASYDNYLLLVDGVKPAANDALAIQFAAAGVADSGNNYFHNVFNTESTAAVANISSFVATTSAGAGLSLAVNVMNANDATNSKGVTMIGAAQSAATPGHTPIGRGGVYVAANAITGVRFLWTGGNNFAATGKIRIYGYNNT